MKRRSVALATRAAIVSCCVLLSSQAWGQAAGGGGNAPQGSPAPAQVSLRDWPTLLDGPDGPKKAMRAHGVDLNASLVHHDVPAFDVVDGSHISVDNVTRNRVVDFRLVSPNTAL